MVAHKRHPTLRRGASNAFCERLVGSIRRECLDFLIPLNERHLRGIPKEWAAHYNKGRPHSSLGPGIPEPSGGVPVSEISGQRSPSGGKPCPGRSASRISTGGSSGVKSRRKPRTTRFLRSTTVIGSIWPKGSRNSSSATTTGAACIRHSAIDRRRNLRSNRKVEGEIVVQCALSEAANETLCPKNCPIMGFTCAVASQSSTSVCHVRLRSGLELSRKRVAQRRGPKGACRQTRWLTLAGAK